MKYPNCAIIGAELYLPREGRIVRGDLHEIADAWIFNAVLARGAQQGEAAWMWATFELKEIDASTKHILVIDSTEYFERRGVVIVDKASSVWLNAAACRHTERTRA